MGANSDESDWFAPPELQAARLAAERIRAAARIHAARGAADETSAIASLVRSSRRSGRALHQLAAEVLRGRPPGFEA